MKDRSKNLVSVYHRGFYVKDEVPVDFGVNLHIDEVEGYTPRKVRKARKDINIPHDLQAPSDAALEVLIRQNIVKNN